jgi:ATP-dependent 26S proteasome regulatory subunit
LMDTIQEKKNVIMILTSNKKKSFFDYFDPALLREYRITESYEYRDSGVRKIRFNN